MVGYETGLQVWKMEESGEASEVVSLRQTPSVCATVVGRPRTATPAEGETRLVLLPLAAAVRSYMSARARAPVQHAQVSFPHFLVSLPRADTLANFRPLLAYANARPANVRVGQAQTGRSLVFALSGDRHAPPTPSTPLCQHPTFAHLPCRHRATSPSSTSSPSTRERPSPTTCGQTARPPPSRPTAASLPLSSSTAFASTVCWASTRSARWRVRCWRAGAPPAARWAAFGLY